jgi:16S rRNA (uracil1498-N3)-methyltransferase
MGKMPRVVAHAFVADLARPVLEARDAHHLSRVLRLRPGEIVSVSDGRGGSRLCRWTGGADLEPVDRTGTTTAATTTTTTTTTGTSTSTSTSTSTGTGTGIVRDAQPSPSLTVAFALTKGEHPEWAVQKLTEAGVDRVVVLATERCVVRWAPSSQKRQLERLQEIARLAAMQSRRSWLPTVEGVVAFGDFLRGGMGGGVGAGDVALAVPDGAPLTLATPTVLVGPEGGWSDAEMTAVPHHVSLGPHVLRAETAALAAGLLLVALRVGLVSPGSGFSCDTGAGS